MKSIILLLTIICITSANIFDSLENLRLFDKQEVFYKSIIDERYEETLLSDLDAYLQKCELDTINGDSITPVFDGYIYPKPFKYDVKSFALNLARHICINDNTCKSIIWKKRNGKKGYMQWEVARTIISLFPDSISILLHEFKSYPDDYKDVPMQRWRTLSLQAVNEYTNNWPINIRKANEVEDILREYQLEWRRIKKDQDTIVSYYIKRMYDSYKIQKELELDSGNELLKKYSPGISVFERIIQNSNQRDACVKMIFLINNKYNEYHGYEHVLRPIELVIKSNCKDIDNNEVVELNYYIKTNKMKNIFNIENTPTPNLYKWFRIKINE